MTLPIYLVDAFSAPGCKGNQAYVCVLDKRRVGAGWMQALAAELNVSETAFLTRRATGWGIRWFTPKCEVPLCGHATLASAHVLWTTKRVPESDEIRFMSASGWLPVKKQGPWIEMDFPALQSRPMKVSPRLKAALGIPIARAFSVSGAVPRLLVETDSEETVRRMTPDFNALVRLGHGRVIVTAKTSQRKYAFVSRYFAPAVGVLEDPVTGSAHCALAPYWSAVLDKKKLLARQSSERGGLLKVEVRGDRVLISGKAKNVVQGQLLVN